MRVIIIFVHEGTQSWSGSGRRARGGAGRRRRLTLSGLATLAGSTGVAGAATTGGRVVAVGAENEYANVISQIGGPYVTVTAVMSNPNTDPHSFESSPKVATEVAGAQLVVQNGLGYDDFMDKIEQADAGARAR